jgi:hypothetical protein
MATLKMQFKKGKFNLLLPRILDFISSLDESKDYDLEIKQHRVKRSLNANNYSWKLTDELADRLIVAGVKISKEECHAEMIFRYGQPMLDENEMPITVSVKQGVKITDFYPYAKEIGTGTANGKEFTHYRIYRGSHTYDTKEMSIFITGIVEECKEQGIDTDTPEIKSLLRCE